MLSEAEKRAFDQITEALAADPRLAKASRATRRVRSPRRGWRSLIGTLERRFDARMRALGR